MRDDMESVELDELDTIDGGLDWGCVGLFAGGGMLAGSPGGPVGAVAGGLGGLLVGLYAC